MTSPPPLIFTPQHLSILGLELLPSPRIFGPSNQASPYPYAFDPVTKSGCFFDPLHDMVSFRMLQRALDRTGIEAFTDRDGLVSWTVTMRRYTDANKYGYHQCLVTDPDLIEAYVRAAFALASP
jgi:hypothetical protein